MSTPTSEAVTLLLPRDWAAKKKTSDAMLSLGVAIAWHNRLAADDGSVADDGSCGGWTGVVVDPTGNDTQPMTEQQYDDMIKSAVEQLRKCRADAAQGTAKLVRVLQHPSALHACIVALPSALDARKYVHDVRNAPEGADPLDTQAYMFSKPVPAPMSCAATTCGTCRIGAITSRVIRHPTKTPFTNLCIAVFP